MKIEILTGREAERLIERPEFRGQWKQLYDRCPWGSVYQGEDFVVTWYATYRSRFNPVIVTGSNLQGELVGLFTLAADAESGQLSVAGSNQAEYQAWLSDPQSGDAFIEAAIEKLRGQFPNRSLTLLFMLPSAPVGWTAPGRRWSRHCHVRTLPRGLMEIGDGGGFRDTLRKKKQSKINRLKRLGNLHLDRIEDPEELGAVFDEVICYQTLRLRAIYNLASVEHDPLKKTFYMNLMRLPRVLHVTALRVDDQLVSAQIHTYNREQALLGLITHSPFYARYSPGELHILMTGVELAKEGVPVFDLTPGGSYKDRYATHHDEVYIISVFFNRAHCVRRKIKRRLAEAAKSALKLFNTTPEQTRDRFSTFLDWRRKWMRIGLADLLLEAIRKLKSNLRRTDELCIYACDLGQARGLPDPGLMRKNCVPDLLIYQPMEPWQMPANKFLRRALEKLEAGHRVYTRVEDGNLTQYGWLIESQSQQSSTVDGLELSLPPNSVLLADFYPHSQDPGATRSALRQVLRDAANITGAKQAYIAAPADNRDLRQAVEGIGFAYQYSLFKKKSLWKVTSWSTAPQLPVEARTETQGKAARMVNSAASESAD